MALSYIISAQGEEFVWLIRACLALNGRCHLLHVIRRVQL